MMIMKEFIHFSWSIAAMCCCFVMVLGTSSPVSFSPSQVKIGALFDTNSTMASDIAEALQLAIQNVNNAHELLNGTQLELEIMNCASDPIQGAASAVGLMKKQVAAVVGPLSSVVAHFVAHIGNAAQVPILSFGATDPNLAEQQFPYFFRVAPSDAIQMEAVATLIAGFDWKEVVVIYTDDDYGANGATALSRSLQNRGSRLIDSAKISSKSNGSAIRSQLTRLDNAQSRVFVLHTRQELGFRILSEAYNLRMVSSGYVWIVTDLVACGLLRPDLDPVVMQSLQGILGMRRYIFSSPPINDLSAQWQEKYPTGMHGLNLSQLNTYALYAYDAVYAAAHAISSHLAQGRNLTFTEFYKLHQGFIGGSDFQHMKVLQTGPSLRETLLETAFLGTSGYIQFDDLGDIRDAAFEYVNLVGKNVSVVAYWVKESSTISTSPPQLLDNFTLSTNLSGANITTLKILWPGSSTSIPRGWVPPKDGQPLKIGVPTKAGYTQLVSQIIDSDNKTRFSGFCIAVFEVAVHNLKYAVTYEYVAVGSKIAGKTNPVYNDLINRMVSRELDAAVGDITITAERLKLVDFTQPYIESGLVVLVSRRNREKNNRWAFLRPYTGTMWSAILGFTMFTGFAIWMLDRHENLEFRGPAQKQLGVVMWFMFSTLFTAHREETKSFLARVVLLLWLFVVLILNSSYTASLTTILTVEQLTPDIQGLDTLLRSNEPIGYQTGSFVRDYLIGLNVSPSRLKDLDSRESYKAALNLGPSRGGVAAIVDELPYIELFLATNCKKYAIAGHVFTKSGWGFAFPRGSEIAEDLSTEILRMSQTGELEQLHDFWFKDKQCIDTEASVEDQSNQLGIRSFWVLFVFMGATSSVCLLIYLLSRAYELEYFQRNQCCQRIGAFIKCARRRGD